MSTRYICLQGETFLEFSRKHSTNWILVTSVNVVAMITKRDISKFSYRKINGTNLTDNGNHRTKVTITTTLNIGSLSNKYHNCNSKSKIFINLRMSSHNVLVFGLILTKLNLIWQVLVVPTQNKIQRKAPRASRAVPYGSKGRRTERGN
jgi:hypothetical protein